MQRNTSIVQIEGLSADEIEGMIDRSLTANNSLLMQEIRQLIEDYIGSQSKASEASFEYYTVAQVIKILKVTRQTLNSWHKSGYLCKVTIGRSVRYPKSAIDKIGSSRAQ
jgi:hypothetical protein